MEKTGRCAKEEASSSLLGKLALPFYVINILLVYSMPVGITHCSIVKNETKVGLNSELFEEANINIGNQLYAEIKDIVMMTLLYHPTPCTECV